MAKGSARSRRVKGFLALALVALVALAATGVWNPFPDVWQWVNRSEPLSEPDVVWQQRVDGTPKSVTIAGNTVVVEHRTSVEARSLATGVRLWDRKADWVAVAGGEHDPVIAVGKLLVKGYELIDPETGAVRRKDNRAIAVWTYRNALLDARCPEARECTLTAWDPRGEKPIWTAFLPGVSAGLFADNPELLGTRRLTTDGVHPAAGGPEPMPALLAFPVDGRVHVVDTATGRLVQDLKVGSDARLVAVGGRVLRVEARSADGTCYFMVIAQDPITGQEVWRRAGINLRTASGAGCVQREDPQGGRSVIVGVGPDTREAVVDGYNGRYLWVGVEGEKLLAVDDRYALARSADKAAVTGRALPSGRSQWTRTINPDGGAALAREVAVIVDRKPNRIVVLDPRTGHELLNLRSSAEVLAVGPAGLVIGEGRDIGYARFGAPVAPPDGPEPGAGVPDNGSPPDGGGKDGGGKDGGGKDG
ncbi:outer membrane protein assembly factor BamB family protein [Micromonospora polyrhachis]|uniref:Outer membrane protein assembly factor BamB n=1 Tax=Micromonospora polyrhachis TaxID=1282883 RepID=A0A7W7SSI9_9ACTN|nr:outer membrane protein assembly factor BamB [Micromonospora polyrhachis]